MIVHNMDVAGIVRRIRRVKYEACKCQSAALQHLTEADLERFNSYQDELNSHVDYILSKPVRDYPKWHPQDIDLGEGEVLPMPENEFMVDFIQQYEALEHELAESQSARMHSSLMDHDASRLSDNLESIGGLLAHAAEKLPLDMPESTPMRAMTGPGRKSSTLKK